jgi:small ligand-binding sensory domain FIST
LYWRNILPWKSAVSNETNLEDAIEDLSSQIGMFKFTKSPTVCVIFVSVHHEEFYDSLPKLVNKSLKSDILIGCSGTGVIGNGLELEGKPGVSVAYGVLPSVKMTPFHMYENDLPTLDAPPEKWEHILNVSPKECEGMLLFPDPYSIDTEHLLSGLDFTYPNTIKTGGLVSGGNKLGDNALFVDDKVFRSGVVGISFWGNMSLETLVSNGCKPIGEPMVVTKSDENIILELNSANPLEILGNIYETNNPRNQNLIRNSLQLGIVMDRLSQNGSNSNYLIRNILGASETDGSIEVGELIYEGQIVQFHIRDSKTANEEINQLLENSSSKLEEHPPDSMFMFSCIGSSKEVFQKGNSNNTVFTKNIRNIPTTGFFSNGEIGQIGDQTFLHGYTSSFTLVKSRPVNH